MAQTPISKIPATATNGDKGSVIVYTTYEGFALVYRVEGSDVMQNACPHYSHNASFSNEQSAMVAARIYASRGHCPTVWEVNERMS